MKMIYLDEPNINPSDLGAVSDALGLGQVSTRGSLTADFERIVADYLGVHDTTVAVNSGTSALHLSLLVAGIGPGDKVLVPATTFVATVNAVRYAGATPVFVDVNPRTWNIGPLPEGSFKAVIPVHLYGNPCRVVTPNGMIRIDDACESLGATLNGRPSGTLADFGCFSFNGNKIITTGGGGLIVCSDTEKVRLLSVQSQAIERGIVGYNYRMPAMNAALGISQMERIEFFLERKRRINSIYRDGLPMLDFQEATPRSDPSWWMTAVLFPEGTKLPNLMRKLEEDGVPIRRVFRPIPDFEPYHDDMEYPVSRMLYERGLCLPSSTLNTERDIMNVCAAIRRTL